MMADLVGTSVCRADEFGVCVGAVSGLSRPPSMTPFAHAYGEGGFDCKWEGSLC